VKPGTLPNARLNQFSSSGKRFQDLIFCHSTLLPGLRYRPDLFAANSTARAGRWEVVGGLWVEPGGLNLANGESIVRQLLYGQRYVLEKFGNVSGSRMAG